MTIKISRSAIDATISVYRDKHHCGMVFCPTRGPALPNHPNSTDYLASPWTDSVPQQSFGNEAAAIAYLVECA